MIKNTKQSKLQKLFGWISRNKILTFTIILVLCMTIFDISPLGGGNIRFYSKWVSCGERPYVVKGGLMGTVVYYEPAKVFSVFSRADLGIGYPHYYCTPLEAEKAGLSAEENYYEYRYLNK